MLALRPSCENCARDLPPDCTEARICSYECTFCADCVEQVLHDVCPNCGGGFERRPVRPRGNLERHPPATERVEKPLNAERHDDFRARYGDLPPHQR